MSSYIIATYAISNPDGYEPYVPQVIPLLGKHGGEVVIADFESHTLEGNPPHVTVVLKFKDEETAKAWYFDADYTPVKKIRLDNTSNGSMVLCKEFVMPS